MGGTFYSGPFAEGAALGGIAVDLNEQSLPSSMINYKYTTDITGGGIPPYDDAASRFVDMSNHSE